MQDESIMYCLRQVQQLHYMGEGVTRECRTKYSTTYTASPFASVTAFSCILYFLILSLSLGVCLLCLPWGVDIASIISISFLLHFEWS